MGYEDAITLAENKLNQMQSDEVCRASGARYEGGQFLIPWFNRETPLSAASQTQKILWLHYLTANGIQNATGRLIAYREAAPALFYEPNFIKRAVRPMAGFFGKNPQKLIEAGKTLGGEAASMGDASVTVKVLPYVPMTFIIWEGDGEFPPDGNILFDKSVTTWFKPEDMAVLASVAVGELIAVQ
jgi:hypothetical protein